MFSCTLTGEKARPIKTIIDVVSSMIEGPKNFIFNDTGIVLRSMESSGAVFINFDIAKDYFDSFELDEPVILGLNIDDLKRVFSRSLAADEKISFKHDENKNKFIITFKKPDSSRRTYSLTLHTAEEDNAAIAERAKSIPLSCNLVLAPGSFKELLADVGIAADKSAKHLTITLESNDKALFEVNKGSEGMSAQVELSTGSDESQGAAPILSIEREGDENVQSVYDMDYLEKMTKLDGLSEKVLLELASENPLRITFNLDKIDFTFLMAPLETDSDYDDEDDD
ncbi:MAG: hypothetical protein ACXAC7_10205 [Candidatus Hodarchaeales archaeon]|jgi:proliferating cell nuclear antigen PCNA